MKINADLSKRAVMNGAELPWVASPLPEVERRMLERDGDEVARLTSLVRYAPGSEFSPHSHTGGEEFLVLDGTFSDDYGDFAAGTYVRNPVGSVHTPRTDGGCTILVKLWWMHAGNQDFVRVDTTDQALWRAAEHAGVEAMALHAYGDEVATLYRLAPDAALPARDLPGGEEFFVLDGEVRDDNGTYGAETWVRVPPGTAPALTSDGTSRIFVKRGHLLDPPPGPPK